MPGRERPHFALDVVRLPFAADCIHAGPALRVTLFCAAMALLPAASAGVALAHEDPANQIAEMSKRIERDPEDVELVLRRSDLHRSRGEWQAAIADLQRASRLDPERAAVDLLTARTLFDAGNANAALAPVERFLAREPDHAGGHLTRGRILAHLGSNADAAAELARGIELARAGGHAATPDDYLERARLLAGIGRIDEAVASLDAARADLDGAVTLELLAIELETGRGRWDAALERLSRLEKNAQRKERWMAERADVLARAGRPGEAAAACRSALAAIGTLPPRLRRTDATRDLATRVHATLAAVSTQSPSGRTTITTGEIR